MSHLVASMGYYWLKLRHDDITSLYERHTTYGSKIHVSSYWQAKYVELI